MKLIFFFFLLLLNTSFSQQNIYVNAIGINNGSQPPTALNPLSTLEKAYNYILNNFTNSNNEVNQSINIYLMVDGGDILVSDNFNNLVWNISGTENFPINITSIECRATLKRNNEGGHLLKIKQSNFISITNIDFVNVTSGAIFIDESDHCFIGYCSFSGGNSVVAPQDTGIIYVGVFDNYNGVNSSRAYGNQIKYNFFHNMTVNANTNTHHAVYLSWGASNTEIIGNNIKFPPSYGIHLFHGDYDSNYVAKNLISTGNTAVTGVVIGYQYDSQFDNGGVSEVFDNVATNNYVYTSDNDDPVFLYQNVASENSEYNNYSYSTKSPNDPFWLGYDAQAISNKLVSGDFDQDGKEDDLAGLYNYGSETRIHVWLGQTNGYSFSYSGSLGWWQGSSYSSSQIAGRIVSGNFDFDTFKDDIAVFYDNGSGNTQIHVFTSNGSSFSNPVIRWNVSGYDATKITNKIVSGDFDQDGKEDDIAAFYYFSSNETRIHVWKSNGLSNFVYSGSVGWWSTLGYNSSKIENRIVSGDFDNDGFHDDIIGFYDYGLNESRAHCWRSNSNSFIYSGSNGWWSSLKFSSNKVIPKMVSGDFDNDGFHDDIAAFFSVSTNQSRINLWKSNGSGLLYQGVNGWWNSLSYNANDITGTIVSGDFDSDGIYDDICAFYDYSRECGSVRTHVWQSNSSTFNYINESLGYPWLGGVNDYSGYSKPIVSIDSQLKNELLIYPNPTIDFLNIKVKNEFSNIEITDINGIIILKKYILRPDLVTIDVRTFSSGIYFVNVIDFKGISTSKFVIKN